MNDWRGKEADIFFLVDASGSTGYFRKQLQLIEQLVGYMDIGPKYTHVGMGLYSDRMTLYIPLNNTMTKSELIQTIDQTPIPNSGMHADIPNALYGLKRQGLRPDVLRPDVPHASVFFTDEKNFHLNLTDAIFDNAHGIKEDGVYMFTIFVGKKAPRYDLYLLSSDPYSNYIFEVDSFSNFSNIRASLSSRLSRVEYTKDDKATCGKGEFLDVLFLFDEYAFGNVGTKKIKSFLKNISYDLSINSRHVRVAVVSKTGYTGEIRFSQNLNRESFIESLNADNRPEIISLLQYAGNNTIFTFEDGAREYALQRLVVFINEDFSNYTEVYTAFYNLRSYPTREIYIVYTDKPFNRTYVSSLTDNAAHVLRVCSVDDLIKKKKSFLNMFCKDNRIAQKKG